MRPRPLSTCPPLRSRAGTHASTAANPELLRLAAPQLRSLRPKGSVLKPSCRQAPPAARVERMALSGFSLHCVPFKPHNMPISQARELLAFHFTPFPRSLADPPIRPLYERKCSMWQGAFASSPHLAYAAYPPWFQSPPVQNTSLPCSGFAFPAKSKAGTVGFPGFIY